MALIRQGERPLQIPQVSWLSLLRKNSTTRRPAPASHVERARKLFPRRGIERRSTVQEEFMTTIKGLVAAILMLAAAAALADDVVYKYQRADGSIIYSNVTMHGAKLIGRFQLVPAPAGAPPAQPAGAKADAVARQRVTDLDAVSAEIKAAEQALKDAQARQQAGVEPLPGERVGNSDRTSRLRPEYFARQRLLADEVMDAQARLDQAHRMRNEIRD
jgi:hypothetical protein